jgi:hypothetical protein
MIVMRAATPSPSHGAPAASSSAPRATATTGTIASAAVGLDVVLGHPTLYALGGIPLDEAVSMAHQDLS